MMPKSETTVMVATVIVTVATHNLAIGVGVGVLVAMVMFARRVAHFVTVERSVKNHWRPRNRHLRRRRRTVLCLLERPLHPVRVLPGSRARGH